MSRPPLESPEERARQRVKDLTGLIWHIAAFVAVNSFLWIRDIATGDGVNNAYWTTIPWGFGLACHALAYYLGARGSGMMDRKYEQFLAEERRRVPDDRVPSP